MPSRDLGRKRKCQTHTDNLTTGICPCRRLRVAGKSNAICFSFAGPPHALTVALPVAQQKCNLPRIQISRKEPWFLSQFSSLIASLSSLSFNASN